jgi:CheY-like chemotaxis protein
MYPGKLAASKQPLKIIFAEDQELYADLVAIRFRDAGHILTWAKDGHAALEEITRRPDEFDLLVTDQQMPVLDGLSLVHRLRQKGFPGRIIVHAGNLPPDKRAQFEELHVDEIVSKGSESDQLVSLAERLCQGAPRNFRDHASQ